MPEHALYLCYSALAEILSGMFVFVETLIHGVLRVIVG